MTTLENAEIQSLKTIQRLSKEIEQVAVDGHFPENLLAKLNFLLTDLSHSESPALSKLSAIQDHLHPQMSLRHFINFMIPIERALGQSLRDDEFLVTRLDRPAPEIKKYPLILVLENLRSAFNVGSIFRLADGLGVSEIHLCGYTPLPDTKTSMGAVDFVDYKIFRSLEDSLASLKANGYYTYALETAENSQSLFEVKMQSPAALIVGNERFGLTPDVLRKIGTVISIPMSGAKNSLNVSNAISIAAYEWRRQL